MSDTPDLPQAPEPTKKEPAIVSKTIIWDYMNLENIQNG